MQYALLEQLNDCQYHSGQVLAETLGVTRSAIWKQLRTLQSRYGIELYAVTGKGYRLSTPIEILNKSCIQNAISSVSAHLRVETFFSIASTNQYLLDELATGETKTTIVLAEHQSAGRGRRGRNWVSPFGANLYLSLLYRFKQPAQGLMGLSLAIAVAISRAIHETVAVDVQLKWPNDILYQGKKLCGILIELQTEGFGPAAAVIGIGLNMRLSEQDKQKITQPSIALDEVVATPVSRNQLAIAVIKHVLQVLHEFETSGLHSILTHWQQLDANLDRPVCVLLGNQQIRGISRGVDENGALLVESKGKIQRYYSGEISLQSEQP